MKGKRREVKMINQDPRVKIYDDLSKQISKITDSVLNKKPKPQTPRPSMIPGMGMNNSFDSMIKNMKG